VAQRKLRHLYLWGHVMAEYPVVPSASADVPAGDPVVTPAAVPTTAQLAQILYDQLHAEANSAYVSYFTARTPPALMADMLTLVNVNLPE